MGTNCPEWRKIHSATVYMRILLKQKTREKWQGCLFVLFCFLDGEGRNNDIIEYPRVNTRYLTLEIQILTLMNHCHSFDFEAIRAKEFSQRVQRLENIRLSSDFRVILMLTNSEDLKRKQRTIHSKKWKNRKCSVTGAERTCFKEEVVVLFPQL